MLRRLDLGHPSDCRHCGRMRALTRQRLALDNPRTAAVQTWCRKCGAPVLLEVTLDYEFAKRNFYALDDQPMAHKHLHGEPGGWGVHWRLDEVLVTLFPLEHLEVCWPKPIWYEDHEAEDQAVNVVDPRDLESMARLVDVELKMLRELMDRHPRTREELLAIAQPVYDQDQLRERFEILGFRAPFVVVRERGSGRQGSMIFQNHPRFYFSFQTDRVI